MKAWKLWMWIVALSVLVSAQASAADGFCDHCGCAACLRKVCVPKMTEREIVKVCWDYKCEDVCVPGPSIKCGEKCEQDKCGCWSYEIWKPTCAYVKTRRVPVKTEVKRKVPAVEWVVEYRCPNCCANHSPANPQAEPAAPQRQQDPAPAPPMQR